MNNCRAGLGKHDSSNSLLGAHLFGCQLCSQNMMKRGRHGLDTSVFGETVLGKHFTSKSQSNTSVSTIFVYSITQLVSITIHVVFAKVFINKV